MWLRAPSTSLVLIGAYPAMVVKTRQPLQLCRGVGHCIRETRFQANTDWWCADNITTDDQMFEKVSA